MAGRALGVAGRRLARAPALGARRRATPVNTIELGAGARRWCSSTGCRAAGRTGSSSCRRSPPSTAWSRSTCPASGTRRCPPRRSRSPATRACSTRCWPSSGSTPRRVVGNSMGGFIAAELAIAFPQRVERLVLVSAAGISTLRDPRTTRAMPALRRLERAARRSAPRGRHRRSDTVAAPPAAARGDARTSSCATPSACRRRSPPSSCAARASPASCRRLEAILELRPARAPARDRLPDAGRVGRAATG